MTSQFWRRSAAFGVGLLLALAAPASTLAQTGTLGGRVQPDQPSERRFAFVVGNSDYEVDAIPDLPNARVDAERMAAVFRGLGYEVFEEHDLTKRGFERLFRRILFEADGNPEIVFFFAGHGVQIGRRHFLIPSDGWLDSVDDVPFAAVDLDALITLVNAVSRLRVVVIDSCRDNPFGEQQFLTELDQTLARARVGFDEVLAPPNSLVGFSTSPGALALDGRAGEGGPFTTTLAETVAAAPTEPVADLLETVRARVTQRTNGFQTPWSRSTLAEPFPFTRDAGVDLSAALALDRAAETVPVRSREFRVSATLDRDVDLSAVVEEAFGAAAGPVVVRRRPRTSGAAEPSRGLARLDDGRYRPDADGDGRSERLTLLRESADGGVEAVEVDVDLALDRCDALAAEAMDPGRVGPPVAPQDLDALAAEAACRDAIARAPETGRFHRQLGRALLAQRNFDGAEAAYRTALDLGDVRARFALGKLYSLKEVFAGTAAQTGPFDDPRVRTRFEEAASAGDPYAFHQLGKQLMYFGASEDEIERGFELMSLAVEVGHTASMDELGMFFLDEEGDYYDPIRGLRYLQESAERGSFYAYSNLGYVYARGMGEVEPNADEALFWFERASAEGNPFAPNEIGILHQTGRLGDPDYGEAARWYALALERGVAWGGVNGGKLAIAGVAPDAGVEEGLGRVAWGWALGEPTARAEAETLLAIPQLTAEHRVGAIQWLLAQAGDVVAMTSEFDAPTRAAFSARVGPVPDLDDAEALDGALRAAAQALVAARPFRIDLY